MGQSYTIAEARAALRDIVDQAEAGLEIELTRRGQPVAVVLSRREVQRLRGQRRDFRTAYQAFVARYAVEDVGVTDEFDSVRDSDTGRDVSL